MIALRNETMRAEIAPALGGAVLSLSHGDVEMLRPAEAAVVAKDRRAAACYPCVPWFGRLHRGVMDGETQRALAPTAPFADRRLPLHGEGWVRAWRIVDRAQAQAEIALDYAAGEAERFPWSFEARQRFDLTKDGLHIRLSVVNRDRRAMPAGLGLHPFFPRGTTHSISFAADGFWTPGPDGGGAEGAIPPHLTFAAGRAPPTSALDHTYTGFSGTAWIYETARAIRLQTDAPLLHFYAPVGEDFFCLEPVTHRPGAFGDALLNPGEALALNMSIMIA